jgi:MFS transporter, DHA1 family, multidrug resistance protein
MYGIIYLCLEAFPLVFIGVHGMNTGVGSLPFLGIAVGAVLTVISVCFSLFAC